MSLSDSCFDFLIGVAKGGNEIEAATELLKATYWYGALWDYGPEIYILRAEAEAFLKNPTPSLRDGLLRTACLVMDFLDMPPDERKHEAFADYAKDANPDVVDMATLAIFEKKLRVSEPASTLH